MTRNSGRIPHGFPFTIVGAIASQGGNSFSISNVAGLGYVQEQ